MIQEERLTRIMAILKKKKKISNKELASLLFCSPSTLRRDILVLEKEGVLKRVFGGVVLNVNPVTEPSAYIRETNNVDKKRKIAAIAQEFIGPGMCLFLDSSSTVQELVPKLLNIPNLIILTNGIKVAMTISQMSHDTIKVFIVGGQVKLNSNSVVGSDFSINMLEQFHIDLAIFSCRGIDTAGIYESSLSQSRMKQEVIKRAKESILLVDSTKFDSTHFFKLSNFSSYSSLITDTQPHSSFTPIFEENDIELFCE